MGEYLHHECDTISIIWVEILGMVFRDRWTQGLACGLGLWAWWWLPTQSAALGDSLWVLQALPASADLFRNLHLYILWQLACVSLGSLFSQTGTIFRIQLGSLDVCRSVPNARLYHAIQGPTHKQVMVLPSRSWVGVDKVDIPASWDGT